MKRIICGWLFVTTVIIVFIVAILKGYNPFSPTPDDISALIGFNVAFIILGAPYAILFYKRMRIKVAEARGWGKAFLIYVNVIAYVILSPLYVILIAIKVLFDTIVAMSKYNSSKNKTAQPEHPSLANHKKDMGFLEGKLDVYNEYHCDQLDEKLQKIFRDDVWPATLCVERNREDYSLSIIAATVYCEQLILFAHIDSAVEQKMFVYLSESGRLFEIPDKVCMEQILGVTFRVGDGESNFDPNCIPVESYFLSYNNMENLNTASDSSDKKTFVAQFCAENDTDNKYKKEIVFLVHRRMTYRGLAFYVVSGKLEEFSKRALFIICPFELYGQKRINVIRFESDEFHEVLRNVYPEYVLGSWANKQ